MCGVSGMPSVQFNIDHVDGGFAAGASSFLRERRRAKAMAYLRTSPFIMSQQYIKRTDLQDATFCILRRGRP